MNAQLCALPRSGTAWIASVLNLCPNTIAIHESMDNNVHVPESSYENWVQAGSHLLLPSLGNMDADVRIYINRDPVEVYDSLEKLFGGIDNHTFNSTMVQASEDYQEDCDVIIDFKLLFKEETVRYIWDLVTSSEFPRDKVLAMLNMNVQRDSLEYDFDEKFLEEFRKLNERD